MCIQTKIIGVGPENRTRQGFRDSADELHGEQERAEASASTKKSGVCAQNVARFWERLVACACT